MDGIDTSGSAALRAASTVATSVTKPVAAAKAATPAVEGGTANLISLLANAAPPIDSRKVEAIRSLIAQGRYPIDESAIAAKMIALDVPLRGA